MPGDKVEVVFGRPLTGPSTWTQQGGIHVGDHGHGTLVVDSGGVLTSGGTGSVTILGSGVDSVGNATVRGAGSAWTHTGTCCVAESGHGTLRIENGGVLETGVAALRRSWANPPAPWEPPPSLARDRRGHSTAPCTSGVRAARH